MDHLIQIVKVYLLLWGVLTHICTIVFIIIVVTKPKEIKPNCGD